MDLNNLQLIKSYLTCLSGRVNLFAFAWVHGSQTVCSMLLPWNLGLLLPFRETATNLDMTTRNLASLLKISTVTRPTSPKQYSRRSLISSNPVATNRKIKQKRKEQSPWTFRPLKFSSCETSRSPSLRPRRTWLRVSSRKCCASNR